MNTSQYDQCMNFMSQQSRTFSTTATSNDGGTTGDGDVIINESSSNLEPRVKNKIERIFQDVASQKNPGRLPPYYFMSGPHRCSLLVTKALKLNTMWLSMCVFDNSRNDEALHQWLQRVWFESWRPLSNMLPLDCVGRLPDGDGRAYMICHTDSVVFNRSFPGAIKQTPDLLADTLYAYVRAYYTNKRKRKHYFSLFIKTR